MSTTHWPALRCGSSSAITAATALPSGSDSRIRSQRRASSASRRARDTICGQAGQRLGTQVVRQDGMAGATGEVAAHRLAHYPQADEAKRLDRPQAVGVVRHFRSPRAVSGSLD